MRTDSPRISQASATVIKGAANEIAVASISGSRANAAKFRNMPAMLMRPRVRCPIGRSVRMALASWCRHAHIASTGRMAKKARKNTTCPSGTAFSPRKRTQAESNANSSAEMPLSRKARKRFIEPAGSFRRRRLGPLDRWQRTNVGGDRLAIGRAEFGSVADHLGHLAADGVAVRRLAGFQEL